MASQAWLSTRDVLWYLVFFGFAVNYMFRININITIVAMVKPHSGKVSNTSHVSECFESTAIQNSTNITSLMLPQQDDESRFIWDEYQQGLILGAFFWLHWISQVPGGILAQKYGTKLVFGLSNFTTCLVGMLIPICAKLDYRALIFIRVLQGMISGLAWPSMHNMAANWIPPNERSKFVTAYLGSSVGAALTFPMCGFIIDWFDWPAVFYVTAAIGSLWFLAWWFMVYDTPSKHPRISEKERTYILDCIGKNLSKKKPPTPWRHILLSIPMWMNVLAQWGGIWGLFTLLTQAPTYFKYIHGMNIRMTGILSGLPHLCRVLFAIIFSFIGDYLLRKDIISRTWVRKFATAISTLVQGIFILGLAYSGCNYMAAIICLTAAVAASGAVSTGALACMVDISPNFASIVMGITNMITVVPGFISPIIIGHLTYQNQTSEQWQLVFLITTVMLIVPGLLYLCFASAELQPWNAPETSVKQLKRLEAGYDPEEEEALKPDQELRRLDPKSQPESDEQKRLEAEGEHVEEKENVLKPNEELKKLKVEGEHTAEDTLKSDQESKVLGAEGEYEQEDVLKLNIQLKTLEGEYNTENTMKSDQDIKVIETRSEPKQKEVDQ